MVFKLGRQIMVAGLCSLITGLFTCAVNSLGQYLATHDKILLILSYALFIGLIIVLDLSLGLFLYVAIRDELAKLRRYVHSIEKYLRQSSVDPPGEKRPISVKVRCVNVQVVNLCEVNDTLEIYVKCRLGYMTENGCPINCPGYSIRLEDKLSKILDNIARISYYIAIALTIVYIFSLGVDTACTITQLTGSIPTLLIEINLILKMLKIDTWMPITIFISYLIIAAAIYIYDRRLRKYAPLRDIIRKARKKKKKVVIYLSN